MQVLIVAEFKEPDDHNDCLVAGQQENKTLITVARANGDDMVSAFRYGSKICADGVSIVTMVYTVDTKYPILV